ncbi:hypothetical protein cypCar_00019390 [Cyprinus carpio]|nr:hypothetical protein cypCar_00019390 [Cyprinus carpio]
MQWTRLRAANQSEGAGFPIPFTTRNGLSAMLPGLKRIYEEGSGPLAVIIIPSLLALSTLNVVSQIKWNFIAKAPQLKIISSDYPRFTFKCKRKEKGIL